MTFIYIFLILILFYFLGNSADILILNVKKIAERLNIKIFIIGIILGILTTMPELFLGINSITKGLGTICVGNIFGGSIIILSLLFGITLVLNNEIKTDGDLKNIVPNLIFILLPVVVGLKGSLTFYSGLTFIFIYFLIIFYINIRNKIIIDEVKIRDEEKKNVLSRIKYKFSFIKNKGFLKEIGLSIFSVTLLIVISNIIMRLSEYVLGEFNISEFFIGLIIFSIGTNLPEFMIIIKSAKNNNSSLSISHLIGSAMANIFILSILTLFNKFSINVDITYVVTLIFLILILVLIAVFYKTKKSFSRKEGFIFLSIYLVFLIFQIVLILK
jgi:cation:H+ antiporter